jgi:hypothetical protein
MVTYLVQKFSNNLKDNFNYTLHTSPPLIQILKQLTKFYIISVYLSKMLFNIILLSISKSPNHDVLSANKTRS